MMHSAGSSRVFSNSEYDAFSAHNARATVARMWDWATCRYVVRRVIIAEVGRAAPVDPSDCDATIARERLPKTPGIRRVPAQARHALAWEKIKPLLAARPGMSTKAIGRAVGISPDTLTRVFATYATQVRCVPQNHSHEWFLR